jgi:DNA-binding Lrp family transcriptional regulator
MNEDQFIRYCRIQHETLDYIEKRSRSANRYVDWKDLVKVLKISKSAAKGRMRRYSNKGWIKEQEVEGEPRFVLKLEGIQRLQWLGNIITRISPEEFKKKLESEGVELPGWMDEV